MAQITALFKPPRFEDEEKTRQAFLLHVILWALIVVSILLFIFNLLFYQEVSKRILTQVICSIVVNAFLLVLVRRGYVRSASIIQIAANWVFFTFTAWTAAGVHHQAYQIGYALVISIAGFLIGIRGALIMVGLSLLSGGLMVAAPDMDLGSFKSPDKALNIWVVSAILFPVLAVLQYLAGRLLRSALAQSRMSQAQYRNLVEHIPQRIFIKDLNSVYVSCNENYAHDLGIRPEQIVGKDDSDFYPKELAEGYRADDRAVMSGEVLKDTEKKYFVSDKERWIRTIRVPYRDDQGRVVGVLGIFEDITERKQAEKEKEILQAQLLQAQKMEAIGQLAGGVAHDFNNMLGVILGYVDMAIEQVNPAQPLHANLQEIRKAAERSSDLTRQLLGFARKQTVTPKVLDLNEIIEGMLKMLRRLIGEDIHLKWLPDTALWSIKVDPSQIDQILVNLCVNARDAIMGVGKVTIETGNISLDKDYCTDHVGFDPGEYAFIAVSDDGCGMDKETLRHVYEPFFTTKENGKGTGLGLATVYGIVKQNNGFINIYSEPAQGTTLKIYLPRHISKAERALTKEPQEPVMGCQETVLVVEDEPSLLDLSKLMLGTQGYLVLTADAPGKAIRLAEEYTGEIHLLMTDVIMPEMNGKDLAKKMLPLYPNLKHLFMSGYTADIIAHCGVLDEGVHFIQKPFSRKDLIAKVRETLDHGLTTG